MRTLKVLIAVGMLASALHFADNALTIGRYPEPGWITPLGVVAAWCVVTAIGVLALTRKSADAVFVAAAAVYSLVLLSGLLHYAFGAPTHMALRSNVTVVAEAVTGLLLAGALLRTTAERSTTERS
jgi:hypothetical protein